MIQLDIKSKYDQLMQNCLNKLIHTKEKIILVFAGMPAAGKTFLIKQILSEKDFFYINKENLKQQFPKNYLSNIQEQIKLSKKSVIIESRHLSKKSRRKMIRILEGENYYFIFLNTPLKIILKRNEQKLTDDSKYLADFTLREMYKHVSLPLTEKTLIINSYEEETSYTVDDSITDEVLKRIEVYKSMYKVSYKRAVDARRQLENIYNLPYDEKNLFLNWQEILPAFEPCLNYDQNNKEHDFPLHIHMYLSAFYSNHLPEIKNISVKNKILLFLALLFHDIGKPYTLVDYGLIKEKTNLFSPGEKVQIKQGENKLVLATKIVKNSKKEELIIPQIIDPERNSHYYNHPEVGTLILHQQLSLIGFSPDELRYICRLVLNHMVMSTQELWTKKVAIRFFNENKDILNDLYVVHVCDEAATKNIKTLDNFDFHFLKNFELIKKVGNANVNL